MNERIRELAERSGIDFGNFESVTVDIDQIEELAQLIVRECIEAVGNHYHKIHETPAGDAIKEHFGVKE